MNRKPNTQCRTCKSDIYRRPSQIARGNIYCSKKCFGLSCREEVECAICKVKLLSSLNKKTCGKECADKLRAQSMLNKRNRAKERGYVESRHNFRERVLQYYGEYCPICDYTHFIEAHHIIKQRISKDHSVENGIPLCLNHHKEAEIGMISIETLYELQIKMRKIGRVRLNAIVY